MTGTVTPITSRLDEAWQAYLDARAKAEASGAIEDGIAAGRAWRRWLDKFLSEEQREAVEGATVIGMRR